MEIFPNYKGQNCLMVAFDNFYVRLFCVGDKLKTNFTSSFENTDLCSERAEVSESLEANTLYSDVGWSENRRSCSGERLTG